MDTLSLLILVAAVILGALRTFGVNSARLDLGWGALTLYLLYVLLNGPLPSA